jgi:hypothetical protein
MDNEVRKHLSLTHGMSRNQRWGKKEIPISPIPPEGV